MTDLTFISHAAGQALRSWDLDGTAGPDEIARLVSEGTAYWEQTLSDGFRLALIRLFSPVVRREEIFLGNVLLNDFLSKAVMRAVEQGNLGCIALLANDLDSYYYLYHASLPWKVSGIASDRRSPPACPSFTLATKIQTRASTVTSPGCSHFTRATSSHTQPSRFPRSCCHSFCIRSMRLCATWPAIKRRIST